MVGMSLSGWRERQERRKWSQRKEEGRDRERQKRHMGDVDGQQKAGRKEEEREKLIKEASAGGRTPWGDMLSGDMAGSEPELVCFSRNINRVRSKYLCSIPFGNLSSG